MSSTFFRALGLLFLRAFWFARYALAECFWSVLCIYAMYVNNRLVRYALRSKQRSLERKSSSKSEKRVSELSEFSELNEFSELSGRVSE